MVVALALAGCAPVAPATFGIARPGPYAPSFLRVSGDAERLGQVSACEGCHAEQARQWQGSAHAHASFDNPWYRHSVEDLRDQVGRVESRHCGGCHDPVLLLAGAMDEPVKPTDPGAAVGVPCLGCHGVVSSTSDGNASVVLDLDLVLPTAASDEAEVARHAARMLQPALASGAACGACHRGFLGPETGNDWFAIGMDDAGGWRGSTWAGSDAGLLAPEVPQRATCVDCHLTDHRMTGAHTPMVPEAAERLRGAAEVWVGAVWVAGRSTPPEEALPAPGSEVAIDVVVRNTGTGHRFPGGTLDAQDTWVAVEVRGADGWVATLDEQDAPRLRARVLDAEGVPVETHQTRRMVAMGADHTVAPGDARAFRFRVTLEGSGPYTVTAVLDHRRHPVALQEAACAATVEGTLDGCAPEPVTRVDDDRVVLGEGEPDGLRAWVHALALSHDVQERLDDARPSLERALALAKSDREAAAAQWLLARVAGRQGRLAEALGAADAARARLGADHPALDRARGDAYAQVWDWPAAAEAYTAASATSPGDTALWRDLAAARGSAGDSAGSLEAALHGLGLQPRDATLLRSRWLALRDLGEPGVDAAEQDWLDHRPPDPAGDLRIRCDREVDGCAAERAPVPVVVLTPTP